MKNRSLKCNVFDIKFVLEANQFEWIGFKKNMDLVKNIVLILVICWITNGCFKEPESSSVPEIQLQSVNFIHEFPTSPDTLELTLKFKDGDGDLGINGDENSIQSNKDTKDISSPYYYYYDPAHSTTWFPTHQNNMTLPKGYQYVNYASHRRIHTFPFDTLPGILNCKHWELRASPADTLYIQQNPYSYNIFVYLFIKNADASYTYFDPTDPKLFPFGDRCVTNFFNGRFPVVSSDLQNEAPLEGTITYKIQSSALYFYLHGKTVKLKIYVLDRAFNKSNLVESRDFNIQ